MHYSINYFTASIIATSRQFVCVLCVHEAVRKISFSFSTFCLNSCTDKKKNGVEHTGCHHTQVFIYRLNTSSDWISAASINYTCDSSKMLMTSPLCISAHLDWNALLGLNLTEPLQQVSVDLGGRTMLRSTESVCTVSRSYKNVFNTAGTMWLNKTSNKPFRKSQRFN